MPAKSKSQQRLFGMVHAYQKGELKNVSKNIEEIAAHISEEDAEHFAKTKHKKLPEKKAGIELREGPYKDVKKIYDALTPEEKNFVTPGRTFYKDVPYTSRRVAYDGDVPIGFADLYGLYEDGSPRTSQNLTLAVSDAARGRRVARSMVDEVIEAAVARARQNKNRRTKVKRIIWALLKDNEASARAAVNSVFTERLYNKPHSYRRFVKDLTEKKAHTQGGHDVTYMSKIAAAAIAALSATPATPSAATTKPTASPQARPVVHRVAKPAAKATPPARPAVRTVAKPVAKPAPAVKTPAKPASVYPIFPPFFYSGVKSVCFATRSLSRSMKRCGSVTRMSGPKARMRMSISVSSCRSYFSVTR